VADLQSLHAQRLERWRQTPATRIHSAEEAHELIERVGIATLFAASSEVPNLYHAYVGDPAAGTQSEWDSPSGEVYGWRWALGRQNAAFYTAIVRGKPTWVSWALLPALIRLRGELRPLDELYAAGELSSAARRITQALDAAGGVLSTGDLRRQAGFPTGKQQRAAYLKALDELDTRLLLAKVFSTDDLDMRHALVRVLYKDHVAAAERITRQEALATLLLAYLPHAVYALPRVLARHLGVPEEELRAGLDHLARAGHVTATTFPEHKGACYVWNDSSDGT
jgi:hypothetical protein